MAKRKENSLTYNWNYVITSLVLFAIITLVVLYLPNIREIDSNILHSVRLALSPYPVAIPSYISTFGFANNMLWPQITAGCVLVSHKKYLKAFLLIFFTQATFVLTELIKNCMCRQRPCSYPGFSFPSMHASCEMCFCGIVIYLIHKYISSEFWRYFLSVLFGLWIFMVCISRLWLGVHFPSDVLAGALFGFIMVNLYIIISKSLS